MSERVLSRFTGRLIRSEERVVDLEAGNQEVFFKIVVRNAERHRAVLLSREPFEGFKPGSRVEVTVREVEGPDPAEAAEPADDDE